VPERKLGSNGIIKLVNEAVGLGRTGFSYPTLLLLGPGSKVG
jgi:hypothetical protein